MPAFRESALRRKRFCCFRVLPRLVCWFCGCGLLCYSSAYSGQASVTGDVVSVKLSVQRCVVSECDTADRTIEKGEFMSGLVDRFRALPVPIVSTIWYSQEKVYIGSHAGYEMSGRARMSAQITKNNKKRVAVKT